VEAAGSNIFRATSRIGGSVVHSATNLGDSGFKAVQGVEKSIVRTVRKTVRM